MMHLIHSLVSSEGWKENSFIYNWLRSLFQIRASTTVSPSYLQNSNNQSLHVQRRTLRNYFVFLFRGSWILVSVQSSKHDQGRYHITPVLSLIFCLNLLCLDHNCAARQLHWTTGTGTSCLKTCRFYNKLLKTHFVCWGILELFITFSCKGFIFFYCEGYYLQLFHTFSFMQFLLSLHFSKLTIQYDGILCLHSCAALWAALHVKGAKSMKAT